MTKEEAQKFLAELGFTRSPNADAYILNEGHNIYKVEVSGIELNSCRENNWFVGMLKDNIDLALKKNLEERKTIDLEE